MFSGTYHLSTLLCRIQITAPHSLKLNQGQINNPKHRWRAEQTGGLSEINRILLFSAASALPSFSCFQHQPLAVFDYEWRPFHERPHESKALLAGRAQTIDAFAFIFSPLSLWSEQRHAATYSNSQPQFWRSLKSIPCRTPHTHSAHVHKIITSELLNSIRHFKVLLIESASPCKRSQLKVRSNHASNCLQMLTSNLWRTRLQTVKWPC